MQTTGCCWSRQQRRRRQVRRRPDRCCPGFEFRAAAGDAEGRGRSAGEWRGRSKGPMGGLEPERAECGESWWSKGERVGRGRTARRRERREERRGRRWRRARAEAGDQVREESSGGAGEGRHGVGVALKASERERRLNQWQLRRREPAGEAQASRRQPERPAGGPIRTMRLDSLRPVSQGREGAEGSCIGSRG
jgi:hypothetical protein